MIMMSSERDKFAEGLALAEEGLVIAQRAHLAPQAVSISRGLAWGYLNDGQFALAQRTIAWVMAELEQHGHRERLSDIYFGARWIQDSVRFHSDDLEGALAGATETHALALGSGNRTSRSGAAANLARVHLERGNYPEALRWAEQSLEIAQAIGSVAAIQTASAIAMLARTALGESGFAARYVDLIDEVLASGGTLPLSGRIVVEAFLAIGDLKRARRIATWPTGAGAGGCGRRSSPGHSATSCCASVRRTGATRSGGTRRRLLRPKPSAPGRPRSRPYSAPPSSPWRAAIGKLRCANCIRRSPSAATSASTARRHAASACSRSRVPARSSSPEPGVLHRPRMIYPTPYR